MNKYKTYCDTTHKTNLWSPQGAKSFTMDDELYLDIIKKHFNPEERINSILEFGPGTGKTAGNLINLFLPTSYTFVDLPENLHNAKNHLGSAEPNKGYATDVPFPEVIPVPSSEYESIFNKPFDLFVEMNCLTETPEYYQQNIMDHVFPNCKNVILFDGDGAKPEWVETMLGRLSSLFHTVNVVEYRGAQKAILAQNPKKNEILNNN
tara:strand:+ start:1349 stop:1969 length:621 start_codon:yes stop_codon:yes gene_type:complete